MLDVDIDKILPLTEARDNFNKIVDDVEGTDQMYVLTKNGKPAAVVVGVNHLEKLTGITTEKAASVGLPMTLGLPAFLAMWGRSDHRVAHNESFDMRMIRIELFRNPAYGEQFADKWKSSKAFCTQTQSQKILNLPPTARMRSRRAPPRSTRAPPATWAQALQSRPSSWPRRQTQVCSARSCSSCHPPRPSPSSVAS